MAQNLNSNEKNPRMGPSVPREGLASRPAGGEKEEKLEFLKREEIRTMQKDVARLREIEAQKERERIAELKTEEEAKIEREKAERKKEGIEERRKIEEKVKEEKILVPPPPKIETPITLIPKPPKRPTPSTKILVRVILVVIILFLLSFFYWFFWVREAELPSEEIPSGEEIEEELPSEEEIEEIAEILIPLSLILVNATETQEIASLDEISSSLSQLLEKSFIENELTRVLFKNTEENKILGLKEFFQALEVKTPEGLLDKLNDDFTLFIYSSKGINRLGFVTKIEEKQNFVNLLLSWEATIEKDTEGLFELLGKEGSASYPYSREAIYGGAVFRYISFPPANFGICWTAFGDKFIFTSSGESMIKAIDKLTE